MGGARRSGREFQAEKPGLFLGGRLLKKDDGNFQVCLSARMDGKSDWRYKLNKRLQCKSGLMRVVIATRSFDFGVAPPQYIAEQYRTHRGLIQNIVEVELILDGEAHHLAHVRHADFEKPIGLQHMVHPSKNSQAVMAMVVFQIVGAVHRIVVGARQRVQKAGVQSDVDVALGINVEHDMPPTLVVRWNRNGSAASSDIEHGSHNGWKRRKPLGMVSGCFCVWLSATTALERGGR